MAAPAESPKSSASDSGDENDSEAPGGKADVLLSDGLDVPHWMFWKRRRYVVISLAFFGFVNVFALRVNVSVAVAAMLSERPGPNGTMLEPEFDWNSQVQGLVLGSYFYGYITTQLLGGWLAGRIGGHLLFGFGVAITSFLTVLTPPLARINSYFIVAIRIIEGVFEGVSYPSMHDVYAHWTPPSERSRLSTIAYSGSYVGLVIGMTASGVLAANVGWPSVFYVFGGIGLAWYFLWVLIVRRYPSQDKYIDARELKYLESHLSHEKVMAHPWLKIFTSKAVWAIIVAHFALNWGFYTLMTQLPMYMKDTLGFDIEKAGFLSALPYLAIAVTMPITGQIADRILLKRLLTTTQVRKLFCCFSFFCQSLFMLLTAFVESPTSAVVCLTLAVGIGSFGEAGFFVNHLDLAPQHASVLMGIGNTLGTLPGIISPAITGYIVINKDREEWRLVFYIASGIYFIGAVFYVIFASGERQKWAIEEGIESKECSESTNIRRNTSISYSNKAFVIES